MDWARILYSEVSFKPAITQNKTITKNQLCDPKYQLCDPNLVKLGWLPGDTHAKIGGGLINVGNTCFLNSVLQCLTYCPPLYNFLVKLNGGHSSSCKLNQFCMLCEMEKHVRRIRSSNGSAIKPISIVQRLKYINKSFQFGRQEDAHEFLRYLIDHMWKACLMNLDINNKLNGNNNNNNSNNNKIDPRIKETTVINHIFGGYHRSQVFCLTCKSRSNTYDFFMDIILDIRNAKSLEEGLKKFTQQETLENENAYKCAKCRKKVTATKKFTVFKAPNVATFQLKRFDSDRIFGGKITKFISYPEEFDIRPYMSDTTKSSIIYQLSAVLVHVGHSSNSGHYFCFIKNSNNFWYRMDDSNVSLVALNTVLQQQAYVLFYTRKPSNEPQQHSTPQPQNQPQQLPQQQPQQPHTNGITTWAGSKSKLEGNDSKIESDERDKFNDELDRGKIKKMKRAKDDSFTNNHVKTNPFQEFTSNGYQQQFSHHNHRKHHDSHHHKNWFRYNEKHKGLNYDFNRRANK